MEPNTIIDYQMIYFANDMSQAIDEGRVSDVQEILKSGFNPNTNLCTMFRVPSIVMAIGLASLPDMGPHVDGPLKFQTAKKIIHFLLNHGAKKEMDKDEAKSFMAYIDFKSRKVYKDAHEATIKKMEEQLNLIIKVKNTIDLATFFYFGANDKISNFHIFPKEILHSIAWNFYHPLSEDFEKYK